MPSSLPATPHTATFPKSESTETRGLWDEILAKASRSDGKLPRKHVLVLGEPGTGKKTLLENIIKSSPSYRSTSSHHHSSTTTSTTTATSSYSPFNYPSIHPPNTSQSKSNKSNGIRSGNTLNNNHHDGSSESKTSSHHSQHTHPKTIDSQQLMSDPSIPLSNLGISYEWLDINNEEGDQSSIGGGGGGGGDNIPNLGFCIPNGSGLEVRELVKNGAGVGLDILRDTLILITLDWSKPYQMTRDLLKWLVWLEEWSGDELIARGGEGGEEIDEKGEGEGSDRLQSYLRHYIEPKLSQATKSLHPDPNNSNEMAAVSTTTGMTGYTNLATTYGGVENLLPLGPGSLTRNKSGLSIIITCTRTDTLDTTGDKLISKGKVTGKGLGGGGSGGGGERGGNGDRSDPKEWGWDERVDWGMQVLRVIALQYGASLFFTSITQPKNFPMLRQHILHRLYTIPPPLHPTSVLGPTRPTTTSNHFPFPYRANILDRDTLMIPAGWDSWGKIKLLRESFDPKDVEEMSGESIDRLKREMGVMGGKEKDAIVGAGGDQEDEGVIEFWEKVMPDLMEDARNPTPVSTKVVAPTEQSFLTRQLESLLRDPQRDPRKAFRQATSNYTGLNTDSQSGGGGGGSGAVGPMGGNGSGLDMPSVEAALARMEGSNKEEQRAPMFRKSTNEPRTPIGKAVSQEPAGTTSNEVLNNFFQGLIAGRRTPAGTPKAT